jgi:hypothetical protein
MRRPKDTRSEQVSLAELFEDRPSEPAAEPVGATARAFRDLIIAAAGAGAIYVVLRTLEFVAPYPLLVAVILAVQLLRRALAAVPVLPPPPALYSEAWGVVDEPADRFAVPDGAVRAVERWEARFGWTERDAARFKTAVLPRLYELVDERLRQRHGVTLRDDPARARALIGEQLWTFLHARVARTPSAREMVVLVVEMEKI